MPFVQTLPKVTVLLFISFAHISCKNENVRNELDSKDEVIEIPLERRVDSEFSFEELRYRQFPVYSEQRAYPKLDSLKIENYKNLPVMDSFALVTVSMQNLPSYYDKYRSGYRTKEGLFKFYVNKLKDTITLFNNHELKYQLNAISGFSGNQQIIVPDLNNNNDFNDDTRLIFPKSFTHTYTNNISIWDTLPILSFSHQVLSNGKVFDIKRKIKLFPRAVHRHRYLMQSTLNERLNAFTLIMEIKDYAKGHLDVDGIGYTVAVQGISFEDPIVVIKPDTVLYPSSNLILQSFFTHKIEDTLLLGGKPFKLDSLVPDFSKLRLKIIDTKPKTKSELTFNGHINNQTLTNLDGENFQLFKYGDIDRMTFVEFWGTWCGPCKELTPKLIKLQDKFGDNVRFIGVALDDNITDVRAYVTENKLTWQQAFVDRNNIKNSIIDAWNIFAYPTFILIDEEHNLKYIGASNDALEYIHKILIDKFPN